MTRTRQAQKAAIRASRLRARLGYRAADSVCPFDIATELGLDVRFLAQSSLEGMYAPGSPPVVLINSLRPAGRRRYTAGHELGHHEFDHGASLDAQLVDTATTRVEEFLADRYSEHLLMPKLAVTDAYARRRWKPGMTSAEQAFVVAQDLGVGFTTLLTHMSFTLGLLAKSDAERLRRQPLHRIRKTLLPIELEHDLFPVDHHWGARPLDVEVGDLVSAPRGARFEGSCVECDGSVIRARAAGTGQLVVPGRNSPIWVRVSKREFVGMALYRHLEDPDES